MGLRVANRPSLDAEGFATAIVAKTAFGQGTQTVRHSKDDIDSVVYERFEMTLSVDGTTGPIEMQVFCGVSLNGPLEEKKGPGRKKTPIYNRLSTLCLALGIVTESELTGTIAEDVVNRVEAALLALEGERVMFQLGRVEGRSLPVPILDSFRQVAEAA